MKFSNAKFIFITFENCDKTCSKIEKTWFLLGWWQKSMKWMKNTAVIRLPQWCNLTLAPRFWAVKVCLQAKLLNNTINRPKGCNLIKKETLAEMFSCEFCAISGNNFLYGTFHLGHCFWIRFCQSYKEVYEGTSLVKFLMSF